MKNEKVTIYLPNEFMGNINQIEARLIEHGYQQYAQYKSVPFVKFIPKRKRNIRKYIKGFKPYILILNGWGHTAPDAMLIETDDPLVSRSKYSSYDSKWQSDFDEAIDKYISQNKSILVADYRHTKNQSE